MSRRRFLHVEKGIVNSRAIEDQTGCENRGEVRRVELRTMAVASRSIGGTNFLFVTVLFIILLLPLNAFRKSALSGRSLSIRAPSSRLTQQVPRVPMVCSAQGRENINEMSIEDDKFFYALRVDVIFSKQENSEDENVILNFDDDEFFKLLESNASHLFT